MPAVQNTTTNWQHLHMPYTEYTNSYTVVTTVTLSPVSSPHICKKDDYTLIQPTYTGL